MRIHSNPRTMAGLGLAATLLATSGCAGGYPGTAVRVGGTSVSRAEVNEIAQLRCDIATRGGGGQSTPFSTVLQSTAQILGNSELDHQFGEAMHATYDQALLNSQAQAYADSLNGVPQATVTRMVKVFRDSFSGTLLLADVGRKALVKQGDSNPPPDAQVQAGARALKQWMTQNNVTVTYDPRYDVGTSGQPGGGQGSLSVPVSAAAQRNNGVNADPASGPLPKSQLCG